MLEEKGKELGRMIGQSPEYQALKRDREGTRFAEVFAETDKAWTQDPALPGDFRVGGSRALAATRLSSHTCTSSSIQATVFAVSLTRAGKSPAASSS